MSSVPPANTHVLATSTDAFVDFRVDLTVAAVVVTLGKKVLLLQPIDSQGWSIQNEQPSASEKPIITALRKVQEVVTRTGLTENDLTDHGVRYMQAASKGFKINLFSLHLSLAPEMRPLDQTKWQGVKWASISDLNQHPLPPGQSEMISIATSQLTTIGAGTPARSSGRSSRKSSGQSSRMGSGHSSVASSPERKPVNVHKSDGDGVTSKQVETPVQIATTALIAASALLKQTEGSVQPSTSSKPPSSPRVNSRGVSTLLKYQSGIRGNPYIVSGVAAVVFVAAGVFYYMTRDSSSPTPPIPEDPDFFESLWNLYKSLKF